MDLISAALQENKSIVEMKLSGNKIMDQGKPKNVVYHEAPRWVLSDVNLALGMRALMTCTRVNQRLVLDVIHLSGCGITADTFDISRFMRCFRYLDLSNNTVVDSNADLEYLLGVMLEEATLEEIIIDTRLNSTDLDRISQTRPDLWSRFVIKSHLIRTRQLTILKHTRN